MANLDYYGFEVNDILKQAENDHESIGMVQVNVLPIRDGVLDERGGQSVFWYWTRLIGNREQGKITADIRGSMYHNAISCKLKLTPSGRETDVNGKIQPGKYKISFTNTDYGTLILNDDLRMMISVTTNDSDPNNIEYHYEIVGIGETQQITVEEDFKYVEISVMMTIDELGNPNSPQPEDKERYQASFDIFPFIRRVSMGDAPFEPYKPDLQTQINELYDSNEDLSEQVAQNTSTSTANKAATLLNADRIGVFPSYQLFPLDKGTASAPYEINKSACQFLVNAEYHHGGNGRATIPPYIVCAGQTSDTTEITEELEALFNRSYDYADIYPLMGDLMPGDYAFSLEAVDGFQEGFDGTNAELYAQIYKHNFDSPGDDILLCEVAVGETGTFTVAESNRYIKIVIVAHRLAGKSWNDEYIMINPYLRRIEFKDKPYDVYVPSLHKQIATMDSSGGYNETQTDTVSDSVEEVTQ